MRELELAGLLHDFGKIYIDPEVFLKAKKLYPKDLDHLLLRLDFLVRTVEFVCRDRELELGRNEAGSAELRNGMETELSRIEEIRELILKLNEPTIQISGDPGAVLQEILSGSDFSRIP